jgi:hypothetical protein
VVEWPDNIKISDQSPKDYAPALDATMSSAERDDIQRWHALPPVWWDLSYDEFLKERRIRMARLDDDGKVLGLAADGFPNEDKMGLHLVNLIRDRIGDVFLPYVHPHFEDEDDERVCGGGGVSIAGWIAAVSVVGMLPAPA